MQLTKALIQNGQLEETIQQPANESKNPLLNKNCVNLDFSLLIPPNQEFFFKTSNPPNKRQPPKQCQQKEKNLTKDTPPSMNQ